MIISQQYPLINQIGSSNMHLLVHFNAPVPELNGPFSPRVHQNQLNFFSSGNPHITGDAPSRTTYAGLYREFGDKFGHGILYEDGTSIEYTLTLTSTGLKWKFGR